MEWAQEFLSCTTDKFFDVKKLGEKTIEQLSLEQLQQAPSSESNSIAIIVKHLSGNMVARWTDLFGSDGEKPGRNRDQEFEGGFATKEDLIACWETGWQVLFAALAALSHDENSHDPKRASLRHESHPAPALSLLLPRRANRVRRETVAKRALGEFEYSPREIG